MRLPDTLPQYELRGADLRVARKDWPCDVFQCGATISKGQPYAHLSHGLKWCAKHLDLGSDDAVR